MRCRMIGDTIFLLRKERKLSQEELAEASELSVMTIRRYEKNERTPSAANLSKIAAALKVPSSILLEDMVEPSFRNQEILRIMKELDLSPSEASDRTKLIDAKLCEQYSEFFKERLLKNYELLNIAGIIKLFDYSTDLVKIKDYIHKDD